MALIKCPECGREISGQADRCIHCGCPVPHNGVLTVLFNTSFKVIESKSILVNFDGREVKLSKGQNYQFVVPVDGRIHGGTISCGGLFSYGEKVFNFSLNPGESRNIVIDYNNLAFLPSNRWECRQFVPR